MKCIMVLFFAWSTVESVPNSSWYISVRLNDGYIFKDDIKHASSEILWYFNDTLIAKKEPNKKGVVMAYGNGNYRITKEGQLVIVKMKPDLEGIYKHKTADGEETYEVAISGEVTEFATLCYEGTTGKDGVANKVWEASYRVNNVRSAKCCDHVLYLCPRPVKACGNLSIVRIAMKQAGPLLCNIKVWYQGTTSNISNYFVEVILPHPGDNIKRFQLAEDPACGKVTSLSEQTQWKTLTKTSAVGTSTVITSMVSTSMVSTSTVSTSMITTSMGSTSTQTPPAIEKNPVGSKWIQIVAILFGVLAFVALTVVAVLKRRHYCPCNHIYQGVKTETNEGDGVDLNEMA